MTNVTQHASTTTTPAVEPQDSDAAECATPSSYRGWYLAVSLAAIAFGYVLWALGHQPVVYDAATYYAMAKLIGQNGLLGYSVAPDATGDLQSIVVRLRTYGYPAFVAMCGFISTFEEVPLHFVTFNIQVSLHISLCYWAAKRIEGLFRSQRLGLATYLLTAVNPLLLIYTTELLSDWLAAMLVYIGVVLTLKSSSAEHDARNLSLSFLSICLATITRPVNAVLLGALGVLWVIRHKMFDKIPAVVIPIVILIIVLIDLPQLVNNYRLAGVIRPLVLLNNVPDDIAFGIQNIKFFGSIVPDQPTGWGYANPFLPNGVTTADSFVRADGPGFAATILLRTFALFDQDYPFPYVVDFSPWYRWPLAVVNYLLLGAAVIGIVAGLRRKGTTLAAREIRFACAAMLASTAVYVGPHLLIHGENRYMLPAYFVLAPTMAYGLATVIGGLRSAGSWGSRSAVVIGVGVLVAACTWLSNWLSNLVRPVW